MTSEPSGDGRGEVGGDIPGETARDRAVLIAAVFAELGCDAVELSCAAGTKRFAARVTDLPGELATAGAGRAVGMRGGSAVVRVEFDDTGARWRAADAEGGPGGVGGGKVQKILSFGRK